MREIAKLKSAKKPLIIHHWDTDGICSAAMILRFLGGPAETMVPRIGMYSLSEDEFQRVEAGKYDTVVVTDFSLPREDFDRLSRSSDTWIFDHHRQERMENVHQFNPVARGASTDDYPSATWVLRELLGRKMDLITVLGAVGDKGEAIRGTASYEHIDEFIKSSALQFRDLMRMTELIDSNHRVGDLAGIQDAVTFIIDNDNNPPALLRHKTWMENDLRVKERIMAEEKFAGEPTRGVLLHRFSSDFDIISSVSRRLSKMDDVRTSVVVQTGFLPEYDRIYVRTSDLALDLKPILDMAKGQGHISGGKREVVGAVVPVEDTEAFLNEVQRLLEASA
jgi:hypothetical protein